MKMSRLIWEGETGQGHTEPSIPTLAVTLTQQEMAPPVLPRLLLPFLPSCHPKIPARKLQEPPPAPFSGVQHPSFLHEPPEPGSQ